MQAVSVKPSIWCETQKQIEIHSKKKEVKMIIVPVKEGENIDRVLKKLKRKFEKTGVLKELRERQKFTKPSVINREQRLKAIYVQQLQSQEEA